jgi:ubiquinone/menaquinone biosynthesis C-methylase UbiE
MFRLYKKLMNATFRDAQRRNLINVLKPLFPTEPAKVLDIGTGDGEFAWIMQQAMPNLSMHGVDVIDRGTPFIPITLYDGHHLPFVDDSFDYVTIINMLHHTASPQETLKEAIRVSRKGIIIKEHYADNWLDYYTLLGMEYLNPNARKLMEMPLRFYSQKEWNAIFKSLGLVCESEASRFVSYSRFWDIFFGRHMHFVGRYHYSPKAPG